MCLRLTYAEALLWKENANQLIADAKSKSASTPCDPLFGSNPRLSSLVSEIDGIKKRHGLLIERALIYAINKLPNWQAAKEQIPVVGGKAHLDCLAYNAALGKLYVFECKRGHGSFDGDKIKAIDHRLDSINSAIAAHSATKGWSPASCDTFILSCYGAKWKSKYPIYDRYSVARIFAPCVGSFLSIYVDYVEEVTTATYSRELRDGVSVDRDKNIFDTLNSDRRDPLPDVLFNESGASFVDAGTKG